MECVILSLMDKNKGIGIIVYIMNSILMEVVKVLIVDIRELLYKNWVIFIFSYNKIDSIMEVRR